MITKVYSHNCLPTVKLEKMQIFFFLDGGGHNCIQGRLTPKRQSKESLEEESFMIKTETWTDQHCILTDQHYIPTGQHCILTDQKHIQKTSTVYWTDQHYQLLHMLTDQDYMLTDQHHTERLVTC